MTKINLKYTKLSDHTHTKSSPYPDILMPFDHRLRKLESTYLNFSTGDPLIVGHSTSSRTLHRHGASPLPICENKKWLQMLPNIP